MTTPPGITRRAGLIFPAARAWVNPFVPRRLRLKLACLLIPALFPAARLRAGPPFLTDDPAPVDLRHWEAYLFAAGDRTADGSAVSGPAAEFNYGVLPDTQLHLVVPVARVVPAGGTAAAGPGETELGV